MSKAVYAIPENCTGCRYCEIICSLNHGDFVDPMMMRIFVFRREIDCDIPLACTQSLEICRKYARNGRACADVCKYDAITEVNGLVTIDEEKCTTCKICAHICPFSAIRMGAKAFKCDLCGESGPQCIAYCPKSAIEFREVDEVQADRINEMIMEKEV